MSETITLNALDLSGESLTLYLRKADGTLLNTGGDAMTESGSTGVFTATLAESRTGLGSLAVRVCTGTETGDNLVYDGWLAESVSVIDEAEIPPTAATIATAVRDVDNSEPEDGSLGATLNAIKLIFNGVTSIGNWLRRIVRKDAGTVNMGVAAAEINTGGTATFDGTTDSLEALRDHGDVSWITGGGGGTGSLTIPVHVVDDNGDDVVGKVVTVRLSGVLQDISEATDSNGDTTVSLDPGDNYEFVVPGGNGFGGATASVDVEDTTPVEIEVEKLSHTASEPESTTLVLHVRDLSPMADAANVPVTVRLLKLANGSTGEGFAQNSKTVNSDSNGDVEFLDFPRGATCQVRVGQSNEAKWVTFVTADGELTNIAGAII